MTIYNNMPGKFGVESDPGLAEYGIIRAAAKKVTGGSKNKFFALTYNGAGEGAEITHGTPDELSESGATLYMMAPDNNDSMNMLHREEVKSPFVGMTTADVRSAIGKILDSV